MLNVLLVLLALAYAIFSYAASNIGGILIAVFLLYFIYLAHSQKASFTQLDMMYEKIENIEKELAKLTDENEKLKNQLNDKEETDENDDITG